jgi:O-acetyl-ADP-ribose deacetylase
MIELIRADITTVAVDAIVNSANSALCGGGGVDGAIHRAAGPELLAACRALGACPVGEAVTTPGFGLPSRFVIHTVGPVWEGGAKGEEAMLERAYESVFVQAEGLGVRSIAFPAISTGAFRFPLAKSARIALQSMLAHEAHFQRLIACLFDDKGLNAYQQALRALRSRNLGRM